jgi:hypothetical protein
MSGSIELLRAWVLETLGPLADDDVYETTLQALSRYFVHSGETDDMEKVPVT